MRNRHWFMLVMALQVLAVAGMIGYKQLILSRGRTIVLETAPRDPRDPLRGDFVRLNYVVSTLDLGVRAREFNEQGPVYVVLRQDGRFWSVVSFAPGKPEVEEDEVLLRGRIRSINGHRARVEYGIESYYVPEGTGRDVEDRIHKARAMEVVVDDQGHAVLKGPAKNSG